MSRKKSPNAIVALIITSALVMATCGKRKVSISKIMNMTNHEVDISELNFFNLTLTV